MFLSQSKYGFQMHPFPILCIRFSTRVYHVMPVLDHLNPTPEFRLEDLGFAGRVSLARLAWWQYM